MGLVEKLMQPVMRRIIRNRWDYTDAELKKAQELGFFDVLDLKAMRHWIKATPVCSVHCSGCHHEGRPFYFNPMGMLITHKCPPGICIHGLSQLSPVIYDYYDHLLQGMDPNQMVFNHITCTDAGLEKGGLGKNMFRVTREKMPFLEFVRYMLAMSLYLFVKNRKARGECRAVVEATTTGGPDPDPFMRELPLTAKELESFLASPGRVRRLRAVDKFRSHRIVIRVVSSQACIAGHKEGDEFLVDAMGKVLAGRDGGGICLMALTKIWWRVMLMLERIAAHAASEGEGEGSFKSKIFDLPMNCYGAGLPLGACGEILMTVELRKL
jgi:uncharacterized repeat protein (TIGR04076 family)